MDAKGLNIALQGGGSHGAYSWGVLDRLLSSQWSRSMVHGLSYALPKVFDLGAISRRLVLGDPMGSWMPLWSSAIFGLVVLATSLYAFERRNY